MFARDYVEQARLDFSLLNICNPQDNVIALVQLEDILKKGANPNSLHPWPAFTSCYAEDQSKFPLLQRIATAKNASDAAELLLKYGADITIVDPHTGNTVLHTAIAVLNENYVLFLIEKIRNSNEQNIKKLIDQKDTKKPDWLNTPLILAFKKGLENVVKALIAADADINISDRQGTRPLHWAAMLRYNEVIEMLLKHGADPHIPTQFNHSALELYQYEFAPLDFMLKLQYEYQCGGVTLQTNLPELSENRFHGFHRKNQVIDHHISQLLFTKALGMPLTEEYIQNFMTQDAIARSAICVIGHEYDQYNSGILSVLQLEGKRLYGEKHNLPEYAGCGIFKKRSNPPDFNKTYDQISHAIQDFKERKENPQNLIKTNSCLQVTKKTRGIKISSTILYAHLLASKFALFAPTTTPPLIPSQLQQTLNDSGMVKDCLTKGFVSLERLIDLHENAPYVIEALRCSNIYQGICNKHVTIEQLSQLTEEQVSSIVFKLHNSSLGVKVKEYIEHNLSLKQSLLN